MVKVVKKKQETSISLLKRFNRQIKESGRLLAFKKAQVRTRKKSNLKKKQEALKKIERIKRLKKLYELGKIDKAPQE